MEVLMRVVILVLVFISIVSCVKKDDEGSTIFRSWHNDNVYNSFDEKTGGTITISGSLENASFTFTLPATSITPVESMTCKITFSGTLTSGTFTFSECAPNDYYLSARSNGITRTYSVVGSTVTFKETGYPDETWTAL
jgi:hypothetical protein